MLETFYMNFYIKLVITILNLAVEKGDVAEVPRCQAVLEFGHIFLVNDKSSEARTPPIIGGFKGGGRQSITPP